MKYDRYPMIVLMGEQQTGETARLLVESKVYPKCHRGRVPKPKPFDAKEAALSFEKWVFPVFTSMVEAAPILDYLVAVQPMSPRVDGPTIPWIVIHNRTRKNRKLSHHRHWKPRLRRGERLHRYYYGYPTAHREGFYVTPKKDPKRVLRYIQTAMS